MASALVEFHRCATAKRGVDIAVLTSGGASKPRVAARPRRHTALRVLSLSWAFVTEVRIENLPENDPRRELLELLDMSRQIMDAWPIPIGDASRMAADRTATPDLLDLPGLCEHYIGGSEGFIGGLHQLMLPRPNTVQIPRFSLFPLIRGVMESGGQTVWVLGPDDQQERFRRLLQLQKSELDYDMKYVDVLTRLRDDDGHNFRSLSARLREDAEHKRRKRWRTLLDAAAMLQIGQAEFEHGVRGGYESIIREAAEEHNLDRDFRGRQCSSMWMYISGMSHPSMWRAWAGSTHQPGEVGPDGYMPVWSQADATLIRDALRVALTMHARAVRLWDEASAAPSPPPTRPCNPPTTAADAPSDHGDRD
jgi:hypothetical protein